MDIKGIELFLDEVGKRHTDSLKHFGIPGMRWGVRKSRRLSGKTSKERKTESSEEQMTDHQRAVQLRKKGVKNLSTKELKELVNRTQLEQQYRTLNTSKFEKGMAIVSKLTAHGTTLNNFYSTSKKPLVQDTVKAARSLAKKKK